MFFCNNLKPDSWKLYLSLPCPVSLRGLGANNLSNEHSLVNECTLYENKLKTNVLSPYRNSLKGIAITVQDITREVELNEAKSQFISNVSHELRTPLFNIKSLHVCWSKLTILLLRSIRD